MSDSYRRSSISAAGAQRVIAAGIAKAEEIGVPMVLAVRDESGILKALARMDGSPLMSVEVAQAKAHTAAATSFDTHGLWDYISNEPQLLASMPSQPGMAIFGGGVPLIEDGVAIGAVGASGGSHDEDASVAEAAAAALSA
jgi:uncharacterized protein GlcG (DUF336 family)